MLSCVRRAHALSLAILAACVPGWLACSTPNPPDTSDADSTDETASPFPDAPDDVGSRDSTAQDGVSADAPDAPIPGSDDGGSQDSTIADAVSADGPIQRSDDGSTDAVAETGSQSATDASTSADSQMAAEDAGTPGDAAESAADAATPGAVAATIGPSGGEIDDPSGARVIIPSGALTAPTVITIRPIATPSSATLPPGSQFAGPLFEFEPEGTQFATPVTVVLPFSASASVADVYPVTSADGVEFYGAMEREDEGPSFTVDPVGLTVTARADHFSPWGVAQDTEANQFIAAASIVDVPVPNGSTIRLRQTLRTVFNSRDVFETRAASAISGIVIHTTATATSACASAGCSSTCSVPTANIVRFALLNGSRSLGTCDEVCDLQQTAPDGGIVCKKDCPIFAHYFVGRDGTVYELADPTDIVFHAGNANAQTIGIEVVHAGNDSSGEEPGYPGAQIAALVRLVDYLTQEYAIPIRPVITSTTDGVGFQSTGPFIVGHREVDTRPPSQRHHDPIDSFPWQPFLGALQPTLAGNVEASGGSSTGSSTGANGADVSIGGSQSTAAPTICDVTEVPSSPLAGQYGDVVIDGNVDVTTDTVLDATGSVYLAPGTTITTHGHALTIDAQGVVVLAGAVSTTGTDGSVATGGGTVTINSAQGGPFLVPSIETRGGNSPTGISGAGASGGNVSITAETGPDSLLPVIRLAGANVSDVVSAPYFGGTSFSVVPSSATYRMGIVTSGGVGSAGAGAGQAGSIGGNGGSIIIQSAGGFILGGGFTLMTGADTGDSTTALLGTLSIGSPNPRLSSTFPNGSIGGYGGQTFGNVAAGNGGAGGNAGNVSIAGTLLGYVSSADETLQVYRFNGALGTQPAAANGSASVLTDASGNVILTINASGGSGAPSGAYSTSAPPGVAGVVGTNGTVTMSP
jgi:hypothetical protein